MAFVPAALTLATALALAAGTPGPPTVTVAVEDPGAGGVAIHTYALDAGGCTVAWQVIVLPVQGSGLMLRSRDMVTGGTCCPFLAGREAHREVLQAVLADWDRNRLRTLLLGPLERLEPSHSWTVRIARAAAASAEWRAWIERYPDHGGHSSNELFVELATSADAWRELDDLLSELGLGITLTEVEKPFARRLDELPFAAELRAEGLTGNPRLLYDAGTLAFDLTPLD